MILRRFGIALLILLAALAVRWRMTSGTTEALGARAERDATQGSVERTLQAEREAANGTGGYDYGMVPRLVHTCHEAVRTKLRRYSFIELDEGANPDTAYIYSFVYRDQRYVGVMTVAPPPLSDDANRYPVLVPPLHGVYTVDGYAAFSMTPVRGGQPYGNASYFCRATVKGERIKVESVILRPVK